MFLLGFGDEADAEVDGFISQAVLFHQLGSTACRADTVLTVVQAQDSAAGFLQFEVVTLFGQFFLSVVGCVEAEAFGADNRHTQVFAFQNCVVAVSVSAVLLGPDVILMQAGTVSVNRPCHAALRLST